MSLIERWTIYVSREDGLPVCQPGPLEAERHRFAAVEVVPAEQLEGAVEALYSAHDFISRVLKWEGDDDTEQSELLAEIAKHLPVGGQ